MRHLVPLQNISHVQTLPATTPGGATGAGRDRTENNGESTPSHGNKRVWAFLLKYEHSQKSLLFGMVVDHTRKDTDARQVKL